MNEFIESMQKKGQENYQVAVKSFEVASKGLQDVSKEVADFSRKSFEESSSAFQTITSANSVEKAVEAQNAYMKSSYEAFMSESKKIGEMYSKLAKEAYAPIEAAFSAK